MKVKDWGPVTGWRRLSISDKVQCGILGSVPLQTKGRSGEVPVRPGSS